MVGLLVYESRHIYRGASAPLYQQIKAKTAKFRSQRKVFGIPLPAAITSHAGPTVTQIRIERSEKEHGDGTLLEWDRYRGRRTFCATGSATVACWERCLFIYGPTGVLRQTNLAGEVYRAQTRCVGDAGEGHTETVHQSQNHPWLLCFRNFPIRNSNIEIEFSIHCRINSIYSTAELGKFNPRAPRSLISNCFPYKQHPAF